VYILYLVTYLLIFMTRNSAIADKPCDATKLARPRNRVRG